MVANLDVVSRGTENLAKAKAIALIDSSIDQEGAVKHHPVHPGGPQSPHKAMGDLLNVLQAWWATMA